MASDGDASTHEMKREKTFAATGGLRICFQVSRQPGATVPDQTTFAPWFGPAAGEQQWLVWRTAFITRARDSLGWDVLRHTTSRQWDSSHGKAQPAVAVEQLRHGATRQTPSLHHEQRQEETPHWRRHWLQERNADTLMRVR